MSLPRSAMNMMGFAVCCLCCDEPDVSGSDRCRRCIKSHSRTRERLSKQAISKADRLSRELVTMLSDPASHIDDTTHGKMMIHYATLIDKHQGTAPASTAEEMFEVFEKQKSKSQKSLIRDVANQNPWQDVEMDSEQREEMLSKLSSDAPADVTSWDELLAQVEVFLEEDEG
ncbi:MAG: hypothetical protein VX723_01590 [Candidatus Thermoplasmatota archaeon]|nr:hypothetical protein [Candidatus Thermoplasmatota archaeon]